MEQGIYERTGNICDDTKNILGNTENILVRQLVTGFGLH